jgi:hypothetical protein
VCQSNKNSRQDDVGWHYKYEEGMKTIRQECCIAQAAFVFDPRYNDHDEGNVQIDTAVDDA